MKLLIEQSFNGLFSFEMLLNDYPHLMRTDMTIPNLFRQNQHHRAVATLSQTTAAIDYDIRYRAGSNNSQYLG
jgi:hypothetical protein